MNGKNLMEMAGRLEKEELLQLVRLMAEASGSTQRVLAEYCRNKARAASSESMEEQLQRHWRKAQPIVEMFNICGGGSVSDEDDIREELEAMKGLLGKAEFPWDVRKEILDEILEEVASDNSGLTDLLVDMASRMCRAKEEKLYLADYLADYGNPFYKNYAAELYLANTKGDKKAGDAEGRLVNSSDYMTLANKYKKQGNQELALQTVLDGLEKAEGRLFEIYGYLFTYYAKRKDEKGLDDLYKKAFLKKQDKDFITELMYGYYKEEGNYAKKKEMLLDLISCVDSKKLGKWYHICQKEFQPEDFAAEENDVLKTIKRRNLVVYFDICIEKGKIAEVLEYLSGTERFAEGNADAGYRISRQLASVYPREIVGIYWKEVRFYAQLGGKESCAHAVDVLREIHRIMEQNSWTDEWNEKYNCFIRESIANSAMITELAKF